VALSIVSQRGEGVVRWLESEKLEGDADAIELVRGGEEYCDDDELRSMLWPVKLL
jgi:hypothetical protein